LNIKAMTLILSDNSWEVKLIEVEERSSDLETDIKLKVNPKISYSSVEHCWRFSYYGLPSSSSLDIFLRDLTGVAACVDVQQQLYKIMESSLRNYFQIESISSSHLTIIFNYPKISPPLLINIVWKSENFSLSMKHPLSHYLEVHLNSERNMKSFLKLLLRSVPIQEIYSKFFVQSDSPLFLPFDFFLIPRSVSQIRLSFRASYNIDIRFVSEELVFIQESSPIPQFIHFLQKPSSQHLQLFRRNAYSGD